MSELIIICQIKTIVLDDDIHCKANNCLTKLFLLGFRHKESMLRESKIRNQNQEALAIMTDLKQDETNEGTSPLLPSSYPDKLQTVEEKAWAKAEVMIRVGIGHDTLQKIRIAAGLHSYYLRHQKQSRGREQMQRVARSQDAESKKKASLISSYTVNWKKIECIFENNPHLHSQKIQLLKGLQVLNRAEDIKFFQEWGSQTNVYMGHSEVKVSWIWTVCLENQADILKEKSDIKKLTGTWESEGS